MSELVKVIAKALVTKPDEVVVSEEKDAGTTVVTLLVAAEDMGNNGRSGDKNAVLVTSNYHVS